MTKKLTCNSLKHAVALLAMGTMVLAAATADAQQRQSGRGGPRLSPEVREAVWTLQANGVAHDIGASEEEAAKIVTAYIAARKSQGEAMREARQSGGGGNFGNFQAIREITAKEREALQKALGEIVAADKAATATESLGTFNNQWDIMADTLTTFKLAEEKQNACLTMIAKYVISSDKARSEAIANQDFQSMRTVSQELKSALDAMMAIQLSEDQLATWKERTQRRGFGGRGGRGGPGGRPGN